jgi:hypothetical protein
MISRFLLILIIRIYNIIILNPDKAHTSIKKLKCDIGGKHPNSYNKLKLYALKFPGPRRMQKLPPCCVCKMGFLHMDRKKIITYLAWR